MTRSISAIVTEFGARGRPSETVTGAGRSCVTPAALWAVKRRYGRSMGGETGSMGGQTPLYGRRRVLYRRPAPKGVHARPGVTAGIHRAD